MKNLNFSKIIPAIGAQQTRRLDSGELLEFYAARGIFEPGAIALSYWEVDRTVLGGIAPGKEALSLGAIPYLATEYLCQRREAGIVNLGGEGSVVADGERFDLGRKDALYIGRGTRELSFQSADPESPARFYLLSYPAHAEHPTMRVRAADVTPVELGSEAEANRRKLYKMIWPETVTTCQLVMGFTELQVGSVWNTMPPHTHARRSEVYLYYDLPQDRAVMHFMGEPRETRHMVLRDGDVALSPNWSIHSGAGTGNYSFVWGMGGENQDFADMDHLDLGELR